MKKPRPAGAPTAQQEIRSVELDNGDAYESHDEGLTPSGSGRRTASRRAPDQLELDSRYSVYVEEVQRLIKAAIEVMKRSEDGNPRVSEVVKQAGLSNDAFYRHFKSKDDLLLAIVDDGQRQLVGYLEHQMAKEATGLEKVRRWIEAILSQAMDPIAAEATRSVVVHAMRIRDRFPQEARRHNQLIVHPLRDAVTLAAEDGTIAAVDPYTQARFIHWVTLSAMETAVIIRERPSADDVHELVQFVFRGLGASARPSSA